MKIDELKSREQYEDILKKTFQNVLPQDRPEQQWYVHPFFSVYVVHGFTPKGIRYLTDQYRYTPHRMRRPIQSLGVEILGLRPVFERMLKPAFKLPQMENSQSILWMPGNQRLRRFDFDKNIISVFTKAGFSPEGVQREIVFRMAHSDRHAWVLPILNTGNFGFDEPLLDAHSLDRECSAERQKAGFRRALEALETLHGYERSTMSPAAYLEMKRSEFSAAMQQIHDRFMGISMDRIERIWEISSEAIRHAPSIEVSMTHGDFQPGNVLISRTSDAIWLIDWEDMDIRASVYDVMTWGLKSRRPTGLYNRVQAFIRSSNPEGFEDIPLTESSTVAAALWAIEEWIWLMRSSARPGLTGMNAGLVAHFKEIRNL